ncbi:hypothetical protein AB0E62_00310 [Streptomyces sp. NPDC038707]|uniref:hypothetical protein n=1 Tax=Streptomyces sp. NPDC038707 TaxID=3154329 RepID=UPI0033D768D9
MALKKYTFTCVMSYADESDNPRRYVDLALTYGDKHQDYVLSSVGDIEVEDMEDEG